MLDLTCPNFTILIGSSDISPHVTGFSFRHPLAEPSTPLIWTGQIELDLTVDTSLGLTFFDDEVNPAIWLSGLLPIDVYFEGTWWQRFRIKPSGYRYDQITGQAIVEITDIIGILDSYQPSADAPEFKTGGDNLWNDLAVKLIQKQAALMGISVSAQTPPYGIGGIYQIPRTISGSYIKEAQKMAGERGIWMWSDKETIKWVEYPRTASNIVWQKSRKELLSYTRQQGLDPAKQKVTVSATHEEVDTCSEKYPKITYNFASSAIIIDANGTGGQRYQTLASITVEDKLITNNYVYTLTKKVTGNPMLNLFGGVLEANGTLKGNPPEVKGYKVTKENTFGGFAFSYKYTKGAASFTWDWTQQRTLLDESDITIYENVPLDAQNASKILKRVITRSEPYAKFPDGLQYFDVSNWFACTLRTTRFITERITTTYKYKEIKRDDIIVAAGLKLYEIEEISEAKEQIYFRKNDPNQFPTIIVSLALQSKTVTTYTKECQGRWKEVKETWQNKGQSTTATGYLYSVNRIETPVTAIPEITYRPVPFPVKQKPLLAAVTTGYAGVSPFVNSNEFAGASTLTTKGECEKYARYLGQIKWQRYYGRELAAGFGSTLGYVPFQGVFAGNGAYIRDRFGVSLNRDGEAWQFVEDCIGNKTGTITEILPPSYPFPALLISSLNIGAAPNQSFVQGVPITPITFHSAGGQSPYTYSSTTLPSGLSLSSGGVLSGTPTVISTTLVTVTVTDSLSATDTTTFNIVVVAAVVPVAITGETIDYIMYVDEDSTVTVLDGIAIPANLDLSSDDLTGLTFPIQIIFTADDVTSFAFVSPLEIDIPADDLTLFDFLTIDIPADDDFTVSFGNPLLDKTFAYFTFDDTASDTISPDSTGDYRWYFEDDTANYTTGLVGSAVQPNLNGAAYYKDMFVQTTAGGSVAADANFDLPSSGFISIAVWVYPVAFASGATSFRILSSTGSSGATYGSYEIYFKEDSGSWYPSLRFRDNNFATYVLSHTTAVIEDDIWLLIGIEINKISGEYKIRFNAETTVVGTGVFTTAATDGGEVILGVSDAAEDGEYKLDRVHFCNAPITDLEWAYLYDSGAGTTTYPFI